MTNRRTLLNADQQEHIKNLMQQQSCARDFDCVKTDFSQLCRVKNIGLASYSQCLEQCEELCSHSICYGDLRFCHCSIRNFALNVLKR